MQIIGCRSAARVRVVLLALGVLIALVAASPAAAGVYDSAVLADAPAMYWRLGEMDGSTTAADFSGNGVTLTYTSEALLNEEAGIANDTDTSLAAYSSTVASKTPASVGNPATFEAWVRTNIPDVDATIYTFIAAGGDRYSIRVGADGLLHASIVRAGVCCRNVTIDGPSSVSIGDGFWHYVTVAFTTRLIYIDLTPGPVGTIGGGFSSLGAAPQGTSVLGSASISLGGANYTGQLDEVAVYTNALSTSRMSAHSSAGGLGWDHGAAGGGEESAPPGCGESGVFWKGSQDAGGTMNYVAFGAMDWITTTPKPILCSEQKSGADRETFTTGQTIRVKLNLQPNGTSPEGYYAEWGPIQYICDGQNAKARCWSMFFNFKLGSPSPVNDVCTLSFDAGVVRTNTSNRCTLATGASQAATDCNPPTTKFNGIHGWKVQHEGPIGSGSWSAWFLCNTVMDDLTHSSNWQRIFTHGDFGFDPRGWPDVEGFEQGYKCKDGTVSANCYKREGAMNETHSNFQYMALNDSNISWFGVENAACRKRTSYRWNGNVLFPPPISVKWVAVNTSNTNC